MIHQKIPIMGSLLNKVTGLPTKFTWKIEKKDTGTDVFRAAFLQNISGGLFQIFASLWLT